MKPAERDDLLIRLDVRTENIEKTTDKQEKHLARLNGRVIDNRINVDRNYRRLNTLEDLVDKVVQNGVPLKLSRKQVLGGGTGLAGVVVALLVAFGNAQGWW